MDQDAGDESPKKRLKEKFEILISNFESRKRNLKFLLGIREHKDMVGQMVQVGIF